MFYSTPKFCGISLGHLGVNMVALGGETRSCHVCLNFFSIQSHAFTLELVFKIYKKCDIRKCNNKEF